MKRWLTIITVTTLTTLAVLLPMRPSRLERQRRFVGIQMRAIRSSVREYHHDHGRLPTSMDELMDEEPEVARWVVDPWDRPLEYAVSETGTAFRLRSLGPDPETPDDDLAAELTIPSAGTRD